MTGRSNKSLPISELFLAGGIALFGLAASEFLIPGFFPVLIGPEITFVVGIVLFVYTYLLLKRRERSQQAETPDPEVPVQTASPGEDLEQALSQFRIGAIRDRSPVDGFRAAAIEILSHYTDLSEEEARRQIEAGTWTDDPYAAAFLADDETLPSLVAELQDIFNPEAIRQRNIRRTVDAFADIATLDVTTPSKGWPSFLPLGKNGTGGSHRAVETVPIEEESPLLDDPIGIHYNTHHWDGIRAVAIVSLAAGLVFQEPTVLLAAVVGVGYAAYAHSTRSSPVKLSVKRKVATDPSPGDNVKVRVTITNEGSHFLTDLRYIDGVPEALPVVEGSPRYGTPLRPGGSASFTYTVTARRGRHEFTPALAIVRNLSGEHERIVRIGAETALTCRPPLRPTQATVPLRNQATRYAGAVETSDSGEGVEFYATREYQSNDPMSRIDWKHRAQTGEFATLQFRKENVLTVVLAIDTQPSAYVSPEPNADHAVDRSVDAATQLFPRLLNDGHQVGIVAMGPGDCWLQPRSGVDHQIRARTLLATDPALTSVPREDVGNPLTWKNRLRHQLPPDAQLIVFSPLCDSFTVRTIRQFETYGYPVTVVSPDPTAVGTPGQRLMRIRRELHLSEVRGNGIPVINWESEETLEKALARADYRDE